MFWIIKVLVALMKIIWHMEKCTHVGSFFFSESKLGLTFGWSGVIS